MQELTSINVQMRLITSDNIEQLTKYTKTTLSQLTQSKPNTLEKEELPLGEMTDVSSEESENEESENEESKNEESESSENNDSPQKNKGKYEDLEEVFITLDEETPELPPASLPPANLPPAPSLPPPSLPPSNIPPVNLPPPQPNLTQLIEEPEIPVNNNDFDEQAQIDTSEPLQLNPNQPIIVSKIE
jgi:hypothetical protein